MEGRKGKPHLPPFHHLWQISKIITWVVGILSGIYYLNQLQVSHYFPINKVRIFGIKYTDHQEIQNLLLPLVNHGFFAVNVELIRDRLLQQPWAADIVVRRNWPDQVDILFVEKQVVARWNQQSLLSETGEIFSPPQTKYPLDLPSFVGPVGQQIQILQYYKTMDRILTSIHAKISYLELTPYLTWKLILTNGISLQVGHKDVLTRLDHFVKVYPKIIDKHKGDVEYVDLRYPNGIAVGWKSGSV